jgi:hypothetical protein
MSGERVVSQRSPEFTIGLKIVNENGRRFLRQVGQFGSKLDGLFDCESAGPIPTGWPAMCHDRNE